MSFFKETDYHGSRVYGAEQPAHVFTDQVRLRVSLTFAWARLQIERFMRLGASPPQISPLIHRGEKHFTLLGNSQRPIPARRTISEIFPIDSSSDRSGRK